MRFTSQACKLHQNKSPDIEEKEGEELGTKRLATAATGTGIPCTDASTFKSIKRTVTTMSEDLTFSQQNSTTTFPLLIWLVIDVV